MAGRKVQRLSERTENAARKRKSERKKRKTVVREIDAGLKRGGSGGKGGRKRDVTRRGKRKKT